MTSNAHSYGPTCSRYHERSHLTRRASSFANVPPRAKAQFFYTSSLPIDDPLSPLPPPSTGPSPKVPPRPFSVRDNAALEEAWGGLQAAGRHDSPDDGAEGSRVTKATVARKGAGSRASSLAEGRQKLEPEGISLRTKDVTHTLAGSSKDDMESQPQSARLASTGRHQTKPNSKLSAVKSASPFASGSSSGSSSASDVSNVPEATHLVLGDDPEHVALERKNMLRSEELGAEEIRSGTGKVEWRTYQESGYQEEGGRRDLRKVSRHPHSGERSPHLRATEAGYGSSPSETLTTGTPFIRAPARRKSPIPGARNSWTSLEVDTVVASSARLSLDVGQRGPTGGESNDERPGASRRRSSSGQDRRKSRKAYVPVGVSRLHLVELPNLQMKPIYWSPVHDIATVIRGTWFYKDSMLPVEAEVETQLEEGYLYNKPWTQTWQDELNSCVAAGAEGEAKAVHRLWPDSDTIARANKAIAGAPDRIMLSNPVAGVQMSGTRPTTPARKDGGPGSASGEIEPEPPKKFSNASVIYVDARDAQILRPSLLPSLARGRTPLGPIRKGRQVGIAVVRGFNYQAWDKLHPTRMSRAASRAQEAAAASQSGVAATLNRRSRCAACLEEEERPAVTDLVLVIHGIGQKLSERVESFHFTHAINGFRREINVELGNEAVKSYMRKDLGGIMTLPINWRSTLTLDDDDVHPSGVEKEVDPNSNQYTLKDITPSTIPAVRNLISDVMLDIPYYLSHHKSKMIEAVIKEANRVYRLWCRNNPGFHDTGRVHLIAHSLGSVMAIDILSKQPTRLPKQLNLRSKKVRDDMFEFDTKTLFLCGSPAGLFLLLNKATLLPRRGRAKASAPSEDINNANITGEAPTYGCLAVDNIYNIMHPNDAIAYRVNAAVDVAYASSLTPAIVPSLTPTFFQSLTSTLFGSSSSSSSRPIPGAGPPSGPVRLPSTIELETHNFSREEIAEKRMALLNDNGQIDFFLAAGGGPLEIQYLNMLGAHSAYWVLKDFVRLVVLEVGRRAGRDGCVPGLRAVKRRGGAGGGAS